MKQVRVSVPVYSMAPELTNSFAESRRSRDGTLGNNGRSADERPSVPELLPASGLIAKKKTFATANFKSIYG